MQLQITRDIPR